VLPGANALRVERLRTGTGVANVAARIERDGETLAHAVAVLGRDRAPGTSYRELAAPSMPSWRAMPEPARASFGPPFANFFEMWPLAPMPFTKAEHAMTSGWVRPREPGPVVDAATIATVIDAYWPATFTRFDAFRPMATIAYTLEILDDLHGLDPTAPLFYTARSPVAHGGYTSEERQLWTEDGRLLARNYQTFAIIT
jgi:acyl-CoA thioesterase